ncbi:hypothetical protein IW261DRAFT_865427 [Armillaria novae-zelandiae]|uniref:MYND-type domain-containing protein n=1 Tax=Armillaria novae-zelandiae TaxID=153914 RepID=A0AA39PIH8_9AGAR|nr:hypothetical protein IW261DRAFT_865427 [Armillaria novae-zelandiae]
MAPLYREKFCAVCNKNESDASNIKQCSSCKARMYCSRECQLADWPTHKSECKKGAKWYDRYRLSQDGSKHFGKLELITWKCPEEGTGWGHVVVEEEEYMKNKFQNESGGDQRKFYKYWPQGFRWTCCGMDGSMTFGCDHHGTGPSPCTCDFCKMGEPLPNSIYHEQSATRMGLRLPRGPDPRSKNSTAGGMASMMRGFMGLDDPQ